MKFRGRQKRFPNKTAGLSFLVGFFVFTLQTLHTTAQRLCKTRAQLQTNIFGAQKEFSDIWVYAQKKLVYDLQTSLTGAFLGVFSSFKQVTTMQLKGQSSERSFQHNVISTEPQSYCASLLLEERNFSPLMTYWNFSIPCLTRMQDTCKC